MIPKLSLLTPLMAACAVAAWCVVLGRRDLPSRPGYAPVAWLLTWFTASNLSRAAIQTWILDPGRQAIGPDAPFVGADRFWFFVEVTVRTAWPFAILSTAFVVFLRRAPWVPLLAWAAVSSALCWLYPEVRRIEQARIEAWVSLACWSGTVLTGWLGHFRKRISIEECYTSMAFVVAAHAAVILVVKFGSVAEFDWMIARVVQGTIYAGLLAYQVWILGEPRTS
jgi:hypothetical protein